MPKFRRKPVLVDAFRLGARGQPTPAPAWFGSPPLADITDAGILLRDGADVRLARWGDWIVRDAEGRIRPWPPAFFDKAHELAPEAD